MTADEKKDRFGGESCKRKTKQRLMMAELKTREAAPSRGRANTHRMALLYDKRIACILWTLHHYHEKTSIQTDVPATALLYDIVNAVYTKMYFLWKL